MANQVYQSTLTPYNQQPAQGSDFWGGLSNFFLGSPERTEQMSTVSPEQQGAMMQMLQRGLAGMDQFDFAPIEQQARRGFQQQTLPSIAERFTSMGGGQRSSAFQQALGQAGAGLEQNLASMKQQYNLQRQPLFQQMINMGLRPQFENVMHARQPGMLETGISSLLGGLGGALGGGGLGSLLGMFGGNSSAGKPFDMGGWSPQQSIRRSSFGQGNYPQLQI